MPTKELLRYRFNQLLDLANRPGLVRFKYAGKYLQAMLHPQEFARMRQLAARPEMAALVAGQPYFAYKHLRTYGSAALPRAARVETLLHHYQQLATATPGLMAQVAHHPVIWQEQLQDESFRIELSYPTESTTEGELSLLFYQGATLLQTMTCTLAPGHLLGLPAAHVLLVCQVQGIRSPDALRQAVKLLDGISPAVLLLHAMYGLAAALGAPYVAGVGTQHHLGRGMGSYFDYDGFWAQFRAPALPMGFFLLDPAAPGRPVEEIKSKHRTRTLRRREFKQQLRHSIEATLRAHYRPVHAAAPVLETALAQ